MLTITLPALDSLSNKIRFSEEAKYTYSAVDGYVTCLVDMDREKGHKIKEQFLETLDRASNIFEEVVLFWDGGLNFFAKWRKNGKDVMCGGIIYHYASQTWSIHT